MQTLLAFPVIVLVLMLQTTVVSSLPLLSGYADLLMLVLVAWSLQDRVRSAWPWTVVAGLLAGIVSALPLLLPILGYLSVTAVARLVRRRVWQTPVLSMFVVTFAGSLIMQSLSFGYLILTGVPLPLEDSLNLVVLPSTLLNLLLALPVHAIVADMAQWVYPEEVEV